MYCIESTMRAVRKKHMRYRDGREGEAWIEKERERAGAGRGGSGVYRGSKPPAPLSGGHVNTDRK